jgi:hypothetical protein
MLYGNGLKKKISVKRRWVNTHGRCGTEREYLSHILSSITWTVVWDWRTKVRKHSKELMYNTGKNYFPLITQLLAISIYEHACQDLHWITKATFMSKHPIAIITYIFVSCYSSHIKWEPNEMSICETSLLVYEITSIYLFNVSNTQHENFYITSIYLHTFVIYINVKARSPS